MKRKNERDQDDIRRSLEKNGKRMKIGLPVGMPLRSFDRLYRGQKPTHFGTLLPSRAAFGGGEYLDGYSMYQSPKGYKHLLTFGMSELYAEEEALGGNTANGDMK